MPEKYSLVKTVAEPEQKPTIHDYTEMFVDFSAKYRNVFMVKIKDDVFIYRALGRAEYREILEDRRFPDVKKEELICSQCLLYPDPDQYSWEDKEAGIPTELMKSILRDSYLDSVDRRRMLHEYYRAEMWEIDNQITCLISQAFPNINLEEIESWDIEKTTKYLSRAEWILQNFHGIKIDSMAGEDNHSAPSVQTKNKEKNTSPRKNKEKTIRGGERKNKLTPEKLREREEFLKKFPEFAEGDVDNTDISMLEGADVSPALRVGWP